MNEQNTVGMQLCLHFYFMTKSDIKFPPIMAHKFIRLGLHVIDQILDGHPLVIKYNIFTVEEIKIK